jgi:hypothetical protein
VHDDLPIAQLPRASGCAPSRRRYAEALLARHKDNVSAAAREAGIDRKEHAPAACPLRHPHAR